MSPVPHHVHCYPAGLPRTRLQADDPGVMQRKRWRIHTETALHTMLGFKANIWKRRLFYHYRLSETEPM